jgi:hypothetical protein
MADPKIEAMIDSALFPFTREFVIKPLSSPMAAEFERDGEGAKPCHSCAKPERVLWSNGRWQITGGLTSVNPVLLFLETVEHLDFETLDKAMASEFGVLTWRLEAAIRTIVSVGRVHVHRWADGSSHFHVWFQGRPAGQLEMYGWGNVLWPQLLPPLPEDLIRANHALVIENFERSLTSAS